MTDIYTFEKEKIIRLVCSLSHTHKEESQIINELCDYACGYLGLILTRQPQTSEEVMLCEYAAASIVINELAKLRCSANKGGQNAMDAEASKKLLEGAFYRLGDLIEPQDFFFEGVKS